MTKPSPIPDWLTSTLLADAGALPLRSDIRPLTPGLRMFGPALTVSVPPGDNLAIHAALAVVQPGEILVIDGQGHRERALMGGIMSTQASASSVGGVVIDGVMRDAAELLHIGLPAFALGVHPAGPHKKGDGSVGESIQCCGAPVSTGDWVFGDDDGVVVLPVAQRGTLLAGAEAKFKREQARLAAIGRGELVAGWLKESLAAANVQFAPDRTPDLG
ncbi:RraA family protein [Variovorax sp. VNK109]|uniref:RraA family protein n=1 Tax=Variovorax sp. VNK109 TaxID=3400919 RepID=UPI003C014596